LLNSKLEKNSPAKCSPIVIDVPFTLLKSPVLISVPDFIFVLNITKINYHGKGDKKLQRKTLKGSFGRLQ
jgi:hypothetical protein